MQCNITKIGKGIMLMMLRTNFNLLLSPTRATVKRPMQ